MADFPIRSGIKQENRRRLVAGVGENDSPTSVCGHKADGSSWEDPAYKVWRAMLLRCYDQKLQEKYPSYVGCSVVPEWHKFSAFKAWYVEQGSWEGYELDKDLLVHNNKIYGPDTCTKVPHYLNVAIHDNSSRRGPYPCGVTQAPSGSYVARMRVTIDGVAKKINIGCSFKTPEEASAAYIKAKKEYLKQTAYKVGGKAGTALLAFANRL